MTTSGSGERATSGPDAQASFDRRPGRRGRGWVTVDDLELERWPALAAEALAFVRGAPA